jgi:hypothetical protein
MQKNEAWAIANSKKLFEYRGPIQIFLGLRAEQRLATEKFLWTGGSMVGACPVIDVLILIDRLLNR